MDLVARTGGSPTTADVRFGTRKPMSATADLRHDTESPKRQMVLAAAGDLFMQQGYGATSMDAIARAAGVSKATLYAHFASKDLLFATIINEACHDNMIVGGFLPDESPDLEAALADLGGRMLRFLLEERALAIHRVVIAESVRFPELGRAFYDNGPKLFRDMFGVWLLRQQDAGRLRVPAAAVAADQFVGMLRTGLHMRATLGLPPSPTQQDIDATVAAAVATFLKAYAPA
jgi:TetR/AcrR family transcriptional repressor of mexJK operon